MLRRPMARLTAAVAVAGTICALGVGAAVAAPTASWSGPSKPVPGALTNDSPALSTITFPNPIGRGLAVSWRGRGIAGHVFVKYRTPGHGWSKVIVVPGAFTSAAPAIASYTDPLGQSAVLVAWAGHADKHIWYVQGQTKANGTISWATPTFLPNTIKFASTFNAPTLFFPNHKNVVMLAWRAPYNHVRYSVGIPAGRGFTWGQSAVVPGNPPSPSTAHCTIAPCTSGTPAVTEQQTSTSTGLIYVFWKQLGTKAVFYSTTTDAPATNWSHLTWAGPTQVPGAVTLTAPAASVPTLNAIGPLLLAYKAPFCTHVRFQTFDGSTWSAAALVPTTHTATTPALLRNILATTTPTTIGNIILHVYS